MYAIIKLKNQRHPTYILKNTLGMSHAQNTSFFKRERAFYESISPIVFYKHRLKD